MTNKEIIQNYSAEQLALFLKNCMFDDFKKPCEKSTFFTAQNQPCADGNCVSCIREWLEKEGRD